jgi:hypothetical protein
MSSVGRTGGHGPSARRRGRWPRRLLALGALAAAALLLVLGLFPQEPLRRAAEKRLRASFGPTSRLGRAHVVPIRLRIDLGDLAIDDPVFAFSAQRVLLDLDWRTLAGGRVALDALEIERPRLVLRSDARATPATTRPRLPPVEVSRVSLAGGEVAVTRGSEMPLRLEGIALDGSIGAGALGLTIATGSIAGAPVDGVHGRVAVSSALDVAVQDLTLRSRGSSVRVSGRVTDVLGRPRLDLSHEARR